MNGEKVFTSEHILIDEGQWIPLTLPDVADGLYNVQVILGEEVCSRKMMIIH
jgi:hypothetical protein